MEQNLHFTYAEILILGPCTCKCFYCLGNEMTEASKQNQLHTDFKQWKNFDEFIIKARSLNIKKVYVSSVNSDPFIYDYLYELLYELRKHFQLVGIRGNAANLTADMYRCLDLCNEEVSLSLNSNVPSISEKIAGKHASYEWNNLMFYLDREYRLHSKDVNFKSSNPDRRFRVSIVVNRYNMPGILNFLENTLIYYDNISYVQLRRVYKYNDYPYFEEDQKAFDQLQDYVASVYEKVDEFKGTSIYEVSKTEDDYFDESTDIRHYKLKFSFWEDVFPPSSIRSFNYFTSGKISTNHLLVPGYEQDIAEPQ